jgi:hypothetical protein
LRSTGKFLAVSYDVAMDGILKTLVLPGRRTKPALGKFSAETERDEHSTMQETISVASRKFVECVAGRDNDGVGGVVFVKNDAATGRTANKLVPVGKMRRVFLKVAKGDRRSVPRITAQQWALPAGGMAKERFVHGHVGGRVGGGTEE